MDCVSFMLVKQSLTMHNMWSPGSGNPLQARQVWPPYAEL